MRVAERVTARLSAPGDWLDQVNKPLLALAATAIHGVLYLLPNHLRLMDARLLPMTGLDRAVPFVPETFWIYWSDYLLVFVAFAECTKPGSTLRFLKAFLTVVFLGTFAHWLFPVIYPRADFPVPENLNVLTHTVLLWFRRVDSPASCMPSLHVAASFLAALSCPNDRPRTRLVLVAWATAVAISTLTTKQHYLIDVAAGLGLALLVWWVFYRDSRLEQTV